MKTDALNRRSRFAGPQPLRSNIVITPADLALFEALYRHGKLSVDYLHLLTKDKRKNLGELRRRLTDFYNGICEHVEHGLHGFENLTHKCNPVVFVHKDPKQYLNMNARYQPAVYELGQRAKDILGPRNYLPRSNSFVHELFAGAFTASVELQTEFVFREEFAEEFHVNTLHPDDLFGVKVEDGYRFFALEIDRGNERVNTKIADTSSIAKKVKLYEELFGEFKTKYKIPNLSVLFATTSEARVKTMQEHVKDSKYAHRFLFKAFDGFGTVWKVPKEILPVMTGWRYSKGITDLNKRASA